jgi:hypothetical protein
MHATKLDKGSAGSTIWPAFGLPSTSSDYAAATTDAQRPPLIGLRGLTLHWRLVWNTSGNPPMCSDAPSGMLGACQFGSPVAG